jgi:hypothetical protein
MLMLCRQWMGLWNELGSKVNEFEDIAAGTELDKINNNIREYNSFIIRYDNRIPEGYKDVYIVDTNIFLSLPEILGRFESKDYVIVPKKVIDELDFCHQNNMDYWLILDKIEDVTVGTAIPYNYEKSRF